MERSRPDSSPRAAASHRSARLGRPALLAALAVVAILVAVVVEIRREIAGALVRHGLEWAGLPDASLEVAAIDWGGIALRELRAGGSLALEIDALELRWSPARLVRGRIDAVRAQGVRLRADLRSTPDRRASVAALDLPGLLLALPSAIAIEDARIALDTRFGPFELALGLHSEERGADRTGEATLDIAQASSHARIELALSGDPERIDGTLAVQGELHDLATLEIDGTLHGRVRLAWRERVLELYTPECVELAVDRFAWKSLRLAAPLSACAGDAGARVLRVEIPEGEAPRPRVELAIRAPALRLAFGAGSDATRLSIRDPRLAVALDAQDAPVSSFELAGASADLGVQKLRAEAWTIAGELRGDRLDARIAARALRDLRTPALLAPLALSGVVSRGEASAPFALQLELAGAKRRVRIDGTGSAAPDASRLRARLRLRPLAIGPGKVRLAELSPYLDRMLGAATGHLEADVNAEWSVNGPRVDVDLALRDGAFETRAARFIGVNGRVRLQGPAPWVTPPDQLVSVALTELGIPLSDGLLRFQLEPQGVLEVTTATWKVLGGSVTTQGPLDVAAPQSRIVLAVKGLDLAEATRVAELRGLSGTGTLDGALPLRFAEGTVFIEGAELRSTKGGGRIQYRPPEDPGTLGSGRPEIKIALQALEDFRYESLRISLDGDARQSVKTELHLRGSNPALDHDRPVEFNISLDAPLASLLRSSLATYRLPDAVERRLRDFPEAELR
jgi:hypothetical protein